MELPIPLTITDLDGDGGNPPIITLDSFCQYNLFRFYHFV